MSNLYKYLGIATVLVAGLLLLLSLQACHQKGLAEAARASAANLSARADLLGAEVKLLLSDKERLKGERQALAARVLELESRRRPAPPKPTPVPENNNSVAQQLLSEGLQEGLVVYEVAKPSTMGLPDARLALGWALEARRIPQFEAKSAADDALISGQRDLVAKQGEELKVADSALARYGLTVETQKQESLALRKENEALVKLRLAETRRWKVTAAVALPVVGYLGWRVGRR